MADADEGDAWRPPLLRRVQALDRRTPRPVQFQTTTRSRGLADGAAGGARLLGGALADDPERRRRVAAGGYIGTAVLAALIGLSGAIWQAALLRIAAWTTRGLRVPPRNALLADLTEPATYGRAYGFERAMDNLGAIVGPLLALLLVVLVGARGAMLLSVVPGLLAAGAILYAIRQIPRSKTAQRQPLRLQLRPVLRGQLGRLMIGIAAFAVWVMMSASSICSPWPAILAASTTPEGIVGTFS
ncbi:MAG: MFS transporter [Candidatus Dormibacteraeota bacterium]|nr:MFS transporter [Candidatus Dormibacteraeota bacterium]